MAVILDGNRRFARMRKMSYEDAYEIASKKVELLIRWFLKKKDIKTLSIFALSINNFYKRPKSQINFLFKLFYNKVKMMEKEIPENLKVNILSLIEDKLPKYIIDLINENRKRKVKKCDKTLNILLGYDGEAEIINAIKHMKRKGKKEFERNLLVKEKVDLLVRTGNEQRISGFLPYQSSQAQFYFEKKMFPEVNEKHFERWYNWFTRCERRFGK